MRLLIFLAFNQYGLVCNYPIILQISIYNWMQNCIFYYLAEHLPIREGYLSRDYVLKIKDNLSFFALPWTEMKQKTKHC